MTATQKTVLHRWWPFVLLLLAGASRWMLAATRLETDSTLASEALGCAWAALVYFIFIQRTEPTPRAARSRSLLGGILLFSGPSVALLIGGRRLDAGGLTIALALTPVVVAIAGSAMSGYTDAADEGIAGRLWPGLAAVTGLLLVLAQPALTDPRTDAALILAPVLTGTGAAMLSATNAQRPHPFFSAALAGAAALFTLATVLSSIVTRSRPAVSLSAVAADGVLALLAALALQRLGATRWSSQFTWLPLLIVLEGVVLMHPPLTGRWVTGIALLAVSSVYLLLPQADSSEPRPATLLR